MVGLQPRLDTGTSLPRWRDRRQKASSPVEQARFPSQLKKIFPAHVASLVGYSLGKNGIDRVATQKNGKFAVIGIWGVQLFGYDGDEAKQASRQGQMPRI